MPNPAPKLPPTIDHLLAPAKLTLSLRVTGTRADGMHLIDAEMVTLDLVDELWLSSADAISLVVDGQPGLEVDEKNLVWRALVLGGRTAAVRLRKNIPAGAGLGGGSADAAAVLRWCGFDDHVAAASIGADVAFCLRGGRARVQGIGEVIESLPVALRTFTLLTPEVRCPTPAVYRRWDELGGPVGEHGNDLEPAAVDLVPELLTARDRLGDASGERPRLAGSGSTWFVEGAYPGDDRIVTRTVDADLPR